MAWSALRITDVVCRLLYAESGEERNREEQTQRRIIDSRSVESVLADLTRLPPIVHRSSAGIRNVGVLCAPVNVDISPVAVT